MVSLLRNTHSLGYPTKNNLRGTPLPEEMRSLGYPAKNILRGTIAIPKGNLALRQVPFFRISGPSGSHVVFRFFPDYSPVAIDFG